MDAYTRASPCAPDQHRDACPSFGRQNECRRCPQVNRSVSCGSPSRPHARDCRPSVGLAPPATAAAYRPAATSQESSLTPHSVTAAPQASSAYSPPTTRPSSGAPASPSPPPSSQPNTSASTAAASASSPPAFGANGALGPMSSPAG